MKEPSLPKDMAHDLFSLIYTSPSIPHATLSAATLAMIMGDRGFEKLVTFVEGKHSLAGALLYPRYAKAILPDGRRMLLSSTPLQRQVIVETKKPPDAHGHRWLRLVENEDQLGEDKAWIRRRMDQRLYRSLHQWCLLLRRLQSMEPFPSPL